MVLNVDESLIFSLNYFYFPKETMKIIFQASRNIIANSFRVYIKNTLKNSSKLIVSYFYLKF